MPEGSLLGRLAADSARRAREARAKVPEGELLRRIAHGAPSPELMLSISGFDVIAEVKRRAPSAGTLAPAGEDALGRAQAYVAGGAVSVSVLTEPDFFGGSLADLEAVAAAIGLPVLRKDFLVDPYQVLESRAAGASGVLAIVRMLDEVRLEEIVAAADACAMFVLLEVCATAEVPCAVEAARHCARSLLGVNVRDLETLSVDRGRLADLAPKLPPSLPHVAESGIASAVDAASASALGYRVALVGSALMRAADPAAAVAALLQAGRRAAGAPCESA